MQDLKPRGRGDAGRQRRLGLPIAVAVVSLILVGGALYLLLILPASPPGYPTYQQVLDTAVDTNGDGWPDDYPNMTAGDTVRIRDRILVIEYPLAGPSPPDFAMLWFPYEDGRWPVWNFGGRTYDRVYDDVGTYSPGDFIVLEGTVVEESSGNSTYNWIRWRVPGGPGEIRPPTLTFGSVTHANGEIEVTLQTADRETTIAHYSVYLRLHGQGMDTLNLQYTARGVYLEFLDKGEVGALDSGDTIVISGLPAGEWELVVQYARTDVLVASFSR